jgi:trimethylamine--corrinoid protein Co-methyltransferase
MAHATLTLLDDGDCRRVHDATVDLLETVGVDVFYEPALETLAAAGATVAGRRVRLSRELVHTALDSAPRSTVVRARHDGPALQLSAAASYFGTGSDCLYVRDPDTSERRRATTADIETMAAFCDGLANIDFVMSMGLPADVPQAVDDLAQVAAMLRGTGKPLVVAPRHGDVIADIKAMAAACGAGDSVIIYAMPSPPLMHDGDALTKVIACAELGVPLVYAPAPNAGATAPRSVAASLVVGNAEVLSGLVLHQLTAAGAPFVYGAGVAVMDMRTGIDPYVVPESFLGHQAGVDMARHYGLPSFSYAAVSDSKTLDEQWSAEAALTALLGALSKATLLHDVGYLESGLQSSYESILLGNELVGYARAFLRETSFDDEALALDEIKAAGPGGNHLATRYTRSHYRDFWETSLFSHIMHDRWRSEGSQTLRERTSAAAKELLARPRPVLVDKTAAERLAALLADRLRLRGR